MALSEILREVTLRLLAQIGERDRNANWVTGVLLVKILTVQLAKICTSVSGLAKENIKGAQDSGFAGTIRTHRQV